MLVCVETEGRDKPTKLIFLSILQQSFHQSKYACDSLQYKFFLCFLFAVI